MNKKLRSILIIGALLCFVAAFVLPDFLSMNSGTNSVEPSGTVAEPPFTKHGTLSFLHSDSTATTIDIEIVEDDFHRSRGLMYRRNMDENRGMLFVFESERPLSFWMKNTHIPLDMVFVDEEMRIVNIHENTEPLQEIHYRSTAPARYCIEVNAFFCQTHGIKAGDVVAFERLPA